MSEPKALGAAGALRGSAALASDAVEQVTNIVEGMHANIAAGALPLGRGTDGRTRGITGLVYNSVRGVNAAVRAALALGLKQLPDELGALPQPQADAVRAAVNGVLGDHLARSDNALAIPMRFRSGGEPLPETAAALAEALPQPSGHLLIAVHGLCMNDRQWTHRGHNHAEALAAELGATPLYLHYNSGRHVSENGRDFAAALERLCTNWPRPVERLSLLCHSMGGLVTRSACHYGAEARHHWPDALDTIVFLGTPHHGAALERGGNRFQTFAGYSPYTAPLARLGMLRSAGVTDLRHGNVLDEDWNGQDRFASAVDARLPLPLPRGPRCYAVAATISAAVGDRRDRLLGDGLVAIDSALGRHPDPAYQLAFDEAKTWTGTGLNHWELLSDPRVYARLQDWLRPAA